MWNREEKEIKDVRTEEIVRAYSVGENRIKVRLRNVSTGVVNGKRILLDDILVDNMVGKIIKAVQQNCSQYIKMPEEIVIGEVIKHESDSMKKESDSSEKEQEQLLDCYEPRFDLEQVAMSANVRKQIEVALSAIKNRKIMVEEWGMTEHFAGNRAIILNFYGKPGTGKSMTAEAIAKTLGKKVYQVNYSDLESKYVGETPKNIRKVFEVAQKEEAVLIFDEADSFLGKRLSSVTQSADYGVNITRSVLLMELEKYNGIVIFTTNLISNYDEAFKRRILLSVYFELPDKEAREKIWKLHLNDKMPLEEKIDSDYLAGKYENLSGADIKDMVFYAALYALEQEKKILDEIAFDYANDVIKERYINKEEREFRIISTETLTQEEYEKEIQGE